MWIRLGGLELADYLEDGFYWGVGDDAVAEVEDVAGASYGLGEDFGDAGSEDLFGGEESDGVEVALDGDGVVEGAPGLIKRSAPVEAEDVAGGLAHGGQDRCGVDTEVDDGDAKSLDA